MKLKTLLLAALLAVSTPALAVDPVKVTADSMDLDDLSKNAVFSGNVVITRTGMTVWADKVVVTYGSAGQTDIDSLTATGNVKIKTPDQTATGRQAVFDPVTQILTLSDNVTVTNEQGTVQGPELTINLATNRSTFRGSESQGGRVTGVFTPR